ncbi:MAG: hypothetical protein LBK03_05075 [Bacteroidales bacterium]|jgi:RHS repeat-associated protein|nr:hypothetical protein [Bacteroidales bacterium]
MKKDKNRFTHSTETNSLYYGLYFQSTASPETDLYFYHPDHLGSAAWVTDSAGQAIQYLQYLPFGEPLVDQRTTDWGSKYSFSAKEMDEESKYHYFGARYYDSDLSIFLSVDPMASKYPGLTPYAYVANNPIKLVDPNGEEIVNGLKDPPPSFEPKEKINSASSTANQSYKTSSSAASNDKGDATATRNNDL